jgi:hypothetical protein
VETGSQEINAKKPQGDERRSAAIKKGLARMSAEAKAARRRRMDTAVKKRWARMSPEAKTASRRRMDAGREIKLARYKAERREWEVIRLRLKGASHGEIAEKLGFKSHVPVRTAVRSVGLPERKCGLYDRGQLFTRGTGVQFLKSLRQSYLEFAALISEPGRTVQAWKTRAWFTNSEYSLDSGDARACIDLRDKIARELLSKDSRRLGLDGYSRPEVLASLFPRYREEYQLLRATLASLRTFLRSNGGAREPEIAAFVIAEAQRERIEKSKFRAFRELVRWLPGLMAPLIEQKTEIASDLVINRLAVRLLAETIGAPLPIVRHAINRRARPMPPERMRELLRIYLPPLAEKARLIRNLHTENISVQTGEPTATVQRRGRNKIPIDQSEWFKTGRLVEEKIKAPSDEAMMAARRDVVKEKRYEYDTVVRYHRRYRSWLKNRIPPG